MSRMRVLRDLEAYFAKNGDMTPEEYNARKDKPYRMVLIKRYYNSWNRLKRHITRRQEQAALVDVVVEPLVDPVEVTGESEPEVTEEVVAEEKSEDTKDSKASK